MICDGQISGSLNAPTGPPRTLSFTTERALASNAGHPSQPFLSIDYLTITSITVKPKEGYVVLHLNQRIPELHTDPEMAAEAFVWLTPESLLQFRKGVLPLVKQRHELRRSGPAVSPAGGKGPAPAALENPRPHGTAAVPQVLSSAVHCAADPVPPAQSQSQSQTHTQASQPPLRRASVASICHNAADQQEVSPFASDDDLEYVSPASYRRANPPPPHASVTGIMQYCPPTARGVPYTGVVPPPPPGRPSPKSEKDKDKRQPVVGRTVLNGPDGALMEPRPQVAKRGRKGRTITPEVSPEAEPLNANAAAVAELVNEGTVGLPPTGFGSESSSTMVRRSARLGRPSTVAATPAPVANAAASRERAAARSPPDVPSAGEAEAKISTRASRSRSQAPRSQAAATTADNDRSKSTPPSKRGPPKGAEVISVDTPATAERRPTQPPSGESLLVVGLSDRMSSATAQDVAPPARPGSEDGLERHDVPEGAKGVNERNGPLNTEGAATADAPMDADPEPARPCLPAADLEAHGSQTKPPSEKRGESPLKAVQDPEHHPCPPMSQRPSSVPAPRRPTGGESPVEESGGSNHSSLPMSQRSKSVPAQRQFTSRKIKSLFTGQPWLPAQPAPDPKPVSGSPAPAVDPPSLVSDDSSEKPTSPISSVVKPPNAICALPEPPTPGRLYTTRIAGPRRLPAICARARGMPLFVSPRIPRVQAGDDPFEFNGDGEDEAVEHRRIRGAPEDPPRRGRSVTRSGRDAAAASRGAPPPSRRRSVSPRRDPPSKKPTDPHATGRLSPPRPTRPITAADAQTPMFVNHGPRPRTDILSPQSRLAHLALGDDDAETRSRKRQRHNDPFMCRLEALEDRLIDQEQYFQRLLSAVAASMGAQQGLVPLVSEGMRMMTGTRREVTKLTRDFASQRHSATPSPVAHHRGGHPEAPHPGHRGDKAAGFRH